MLGFYEKRKFLPNEKVWLGKYRNLTNILHWHTECELIRVMEGTAKIRIGEDIYSCSSGDCLFCGGEIPHYILTESTSVVEVMIFHQSIGKGIVDRYTLQTPLLTDSKYASEGFQKIRNIADEKPVFYSETLEVTARKILLNIFNHEPIRPNTSQKSMAKVLTDRINEQYTTITFSDMAQFSGYSEAHFSKLFKRLAGMTFSQYLNYIKTEYAVSMLRQEPSRTATEICSLCGFGTIRNFNRVFKQITGYTPSTLPKDYTIDRYHGIKSNEDFDPTQQPSQLI